MMTCTTKPKVAVQAKLLEIHRNTQAVRQKRRGEQLVLAMNRSDYMLDEPSDTLLQVSYSMCSNASYLHPSMSSHGSLGWSERIHARALWPSISL